MNTLTDDCMAYSIQLESGTIGRVQVGVHPYIGQVLTVRYLDQDGVEHQETGPVALFVEALESHDHLE